MTKADFDSIYVAPDPRPYFRSLGALDYQIPGHGQRIFEPLVEHLAERSGRPPRVIDLCCSYGINGALLKHDVTIEEMTERYGDTSLDRLDGAGLRDADKGWYAARRRLDGPEVVGIDSSGPAVDYATGVGVLDGGLVADLESPGGLPPLPPSDADVELVTVTGGIGYITEQTVGKVLAAADGGAEEVWMAALSLRWVDFEPIAATAEGLGLETAVLDDVTFPQRRFESEGEQAFVLEQLDAAGIDPTGREADGYHHADLYLLRPAAGAGDPVEDLVAPALDHPAVAR